jgi:hypothetical protein
VWCADVLRRPARELYRVYDEHAFLSVAFADGADAAAVLQPASGRDRGLAVVVAVLLALGAAGALLVIDATIFRGRGRAGAPGGRAEGMLAASAGERRTHALARSALRAGSPARAASAASRRSSGHSSRPRAATTVATEGAPAGATATATAAAVAVATVQAAGRGTPTGEFGFER